MFHAQLRDMSTVPERLRQKKDINARSNLLNLLLIIQKQVATEFCMVTYRHFAVPPNIMLEMKCTNLRKLQQFSALLKPYDKDLLFHVPFKHQNNTPKCKTSGATTLVNGRC